MYLIVGLGNPGTEYAKNRHNIGFMVVDSLQKTLNADEFRLNKKLQGEMSLVKSSRLGELILAKPQTFMNDSGACVSAIARYYGIKTSDIIVIHDELDLPFSTIKISVNRGPAGHNGIKSLITHLNTQDFIRIRVGIGTEKMKEKSARMPSEKFVLKDFSKKEQKNLPDVIARSIAGIQNILSHGIEMAMNETNQQK